MKNLFLVFAAIILLSGCTTFEIGSSVAKRQQGYYKVGKPYEVEGETYTPHENSSYDETGIASWYGPGFHGGQTANGEKYDAYDLTAAHRTLPLPSLVRVSNLDNGKSVVVRVNDRGPFARGRIIDVSRRAAELLEFTGPGTAKVRVQLMDMESKAIQSAAKKGVIVANLDQLSQMQGQQVNLPSIPSTPITAEELPAPAGSEQQILAKAGLAQNLAGSYDAAGRFQPSPSVRQLAAHPNSKIFVQAGAFGNKANAARLSQKLSALGRVHVSTVEKAGKIFYRVRVGPVNNVTDADTLLNRVLKAGANDAKTIVDY